MVRRPRVRHVLEYGRQKTCRKHRKAAGMTALAPFVAGPGPPAMVRRRSPTLVVRGVVREAQPLVRPSLGSQLFQLSSCKRTRRIAYLRLG